MKILFTEPPVENVDDKGLEILKELGAVEVASDTREETLRRTISDADALIVRLVKVTSSIIEGAPKLKIIGRTGAGVDNIDVEAATRNGILVTNVPAINADSVAEHTFGLIIALSRGVLRFDSEVKRGNWRARDDLISLNVELYGKTLGIIGLGAIGRRVAKIGRAFGMRIITFDPYVSNEALQETAAENVNLERLLSESDVITIHVTRTKETYHMIANQQFRLMKESALLINCSRGDVIDEKSLVDTLRENKIRGVGLDVFESEPLSLQSPLLKFANVIITPHVAGFTKEAREKTIMILAEDVARALNGQRPINLVNKEVVPRVFKNSPMLK
jgi:D-3-phosphoglycerate dehydrogenase